MKVQIYNWAFEKECEKVITKFGYFNHQVLDLDEGEFRDLTYSFFTEGFNVMLFHNNDYHVLAIDTKRFQMRG